MTTQKTRGKRKKRHFVFAEDGRVLAHEKLCNEFFERVFDMEPLFVSDESLLSDFSEGILDGTEAWRAGTEALRVRIFEIYGVRPRSDYLADILDQIASLPRE